MSADDKRPLLLLDGMSMAFRAFFALSPEIRTSTGLATNAVQGFASMLLALVRNHHPRALVVAFDLPGGSFRNQLIDDYKGGRDATPDDLEHQFGLIRDLCDVLAIPVVGIPGYEADDVLATLACWGRDEQIPTIVVTGDRDSFQLVEDPYIRVLYNKRGVSDYDLYDEAGIFERCGVEPARYPQFAAMRGDTSDNLPGVPGVGEKTAAKLLAQYRDIEEILANTETMTPKLRENMDASADLVRHNVTLMTLVRDVPIDTDPKDFHLGGWSRAEIASFFDRFEMHSLRNRFDKVLNEGLFGEPDGGEATTQAASHTVTLVDASRFSPTAEMLVVGTSESAIAVTPGGDAVNGTWSELRALAPDATWWGHDLKELIRAASEDGERVRWSDDTAVMAYLIDPVAGDYRLETIARQYVGIQLQAPTASLFDGPSSTYLLELAGALPLVRAALAAEVTTAGLTEIYETIDRPLVGVLADMEAIGIGVDRDILSSISVDLQREVELLDAQIQEMAGHPFKVNSPAQLQVVLFEELQLPPTKKIKSGFSTDAASLEAISAQHPIVPLIMRFREVDKLRGTYGTALIDAMGPDGRIHARFNQMVARTGRLSSDNPNLHNIPVRTQEGRKFRYAFVPAPGHQFIVSDYNQIELRVLAHLSHDPGLVEAFASGEDVHRRIAATVFHCDPADVTPAQREQAKAVSYGLAYGMEAYGLSQRLSISVGEAKVIMDQYFAGFPALSAYFEQAVADARRDGFSRTTMGRIRPFPDLATASGAQKAAAERQAMNAGIQGMAADIFKLALVQLDDELRESGLTSRIVLQVHDEVIVEAPDGEVAAASVIIRRVLTEVTTMDVPLEVSLAVGDSWASAKG